MNHNSFKVTCGNFKFFIQIWYLGSIGIQRYSIGTLRNGITKTSPKEVIMLLLPKKIGIYRVRHIDRLAIEQLAPIHKWTFRLVRDRHPNTRIGVAPS
ncbi:hypothetical protein D3C73_1102100 [compost metagenome]